MVQKVLFVRFLACISVLLSAGTIYADEGSIIRSAPRLAEIMVRILQFFLGFVGVLAMVVIVFAGITYMTAGGDPERVTRAKMILLGGIVGLVIALTSLLFTNVWMSTFS